MRKRNGELIKLIDALKESERTPMEDTDLADRDRFLAYVHEQSSYYQTSLADAQQKLDELDRPPSGSRECSTLDFILTGSQKKALSQNGREAAEQSFQSWKARS